MKIAKKIKSRCKDIKFKNGKAAVSSGLVLLLVFGVLFQGISLGARSLRSVTANATDWGMSYQTEGEPPVGNATYEYLDKYGARFYEKTDEKCVYLTFDAGYENGYTPAILDALKNTGVKAAFFVVGNFIRDEPALIKRMTDEGHLVVNHTMSHPDATKLSEAQFCAQLKDLEKLYYDTTGKEMAKFYRPPSGIFNESNLIYAKDMGYKTIFWSVAYVDWKNDAQPAKADALQTLNKRVHNGAIILLHTTSETNSLILEEFINGLKAEGYVFKELTELEF